MPRNETDNPNIMNFNKNSIFSLSPIPIENINPMITNILIPRESVKAAFKTIRDQIIFTDKRIIAMNIQGIGVRKMFVSFPYKNIQYFSVQTPGLLEIVTDAELTLYFNNGFTAVYEFRGKTDIGTLVQLIAPYTL